MNNNWAEVELYRNQYDELPCENAKEINFVEAYKKAAQNLLDGKLDTFNAASLLKYAAYVCESSCYRQFYDKELNKNKCFLCNDAVATVRGSIGDVVHRVDVFYCDPCCEELFKSKDRRGKNQPRR